MLWCGLVRCDVRCDVMWWEMWCEMWCDVMWDMMWWEMWCGERCDVRCDVRCIVRCGVRCDVMWWDVVVLKLRSSELSQLNFLRQAWNEDGEANTLKQVQQQRRTETESKGGKKGKKGMKGQRTEGKERKEGNEREKGQKGKKRKRRNERKERGWEDKERKDRKESKDRKEWKQRRTPSVFAYKYFRRTLWFTFCQRHWDLLQSFPNSEAYPPSRLLIRLSCLANSSDATSQLWIHILLHPCWVHKKFEISNFHAHLVCWEDWWLWKPNSSHYWKDSTAPQNNLKSVHIWLYYTSSSDNPLIARQATAQLHFTSYCLFVQLTMTLYWCPYSVAEFLCINESASLKMWLDAAKSIRVRSILRRRPSLLHPEPGIPPSRETEVNFRNFHTYATIMQLLESSWPWSSNSPLKVETGLLFCKVQRYVQGAKNCKEEQMERGQVTCRGFPILS